MQWSIIILCALFSVSQGRIFRPSPRIVNGTNAEEGEFPYQISLQKYKQHFCGGSILNENYVVSAAHCVVRKKAEDIEIVAGTIIKTKPNQIRQAVEIIIHKGYNSSDSYKNDIALIKVYTPFKFSLLVQPISLPKLHAKIETKSSAVVSGWGRLGGLENKPSLLLQKVKISIADPEYCKNVMSKQNKIIYPTQICANDLSSRKGQCNGDSGGPLVAERILIGIVSWSIKDPYCASTIYPGVYTRVSEFVDWIDKHTLYKI